MPHCRFIVFRSLLKWNHGIFALDYSVVTYIMKFYRNDLGFQEGD
jgi:hypothetical protein